MWLRYVTVHADRRGEGIGPQLARFTTRRIHERDYQRVKIAVNNPYAYQALYRAGFGFTGEETGIAELVLEHPKPNEGQYQDGLDVYRGRDLSPDRRGISGGEGRPPSAAPGRTVSGPTTENTVERSKNQLRPLHRSFSR